MVSDADREVLRASVPFEQVLWACRTTLAGLLLAGPALALGGVPGLGSWPLRLMVVAWVMVAAGVVLTWAGNRSLTRLARTLLADRAGAADRHPAADRDLAADRVVRDMVLAEVLRLGR